MPTMNTTRKFALGAATALTAAGLAACGGDPAPEEVALTQQEAEQIALDDAGVTRETVTDFDTSELDEESNTPVWEIDFEVDGNDYEYDIDANTGDIVTKETDA